MLGLPLAFTAPLALAGLAILPLLFYLLRVTPPRPRQVPYFPLFLFRDLQSPQKTPAHTPWWLLALRLAIAALVILAVAGPILNPFRGGDAGRGPLLVVLDDGWAAAPTWDGRIAAAAERIAAAGREGRPSAVLAVSEGRRAPRLGDAVATTTRLNALRPVPYLPDRLPALDAAKEFLGAEKGTSVVWFADGLASGDADAFAEGLGRAVGDGALTLVRSPEPVRAVARPDNAPGALSVHVLRSAAAGNPKGQLRAVDLKGLLVGETGYDFGSATEADARFDLPIELRNEIARIEIAGERSAGAVTLLDERWKRHRVGIVTGATADVAQPLLAPSYYLAKALGPFADVREAPAGASDPIAALLDEKVSMLVLADLGAVVGPNHDRIVQFVENGGVLLRFAGTRLASASDDDLLPVEVRRGGRTLGGALSWESPKRLAPFERASPFFGLEVPNEVTISRQVLAEPEPGLPGKTWAALADGTPLVTAERRGKGEVVLFHVTADTTWSNLPLSGLFVDMLHRVVGLAAQGGTAADVGQGSASPGTAAADAPETVLAPVRTLDGFGTFGAPPVTAKPIRPNDAEPAGPEHPPGFYGAADAFVAINTLGPKDTLPPAALAGFSGTVEELRTAAPVDLRPWLIVAAVLGLLADGVAAMWLAGGGFRLFGRRAASATLALLIAVATLAGPQPPARAETAPPDPPLSTRDMESVLTTRLAYVATGDAGADEASRLGLAALSRALSERTSLSPADPVGIDPARDELAFYPLIYWPIVATRPQPPRDAVLKIAAFMKQGGTVVFDTRDALTARPGGPASPEALWLRQLLAGVDVPELEPIPRDHVITKTFYLIEGFVGRTTVGQTWIEALPPDEVSDPANRPARAGDSVSPIIITSNDLAGAWAVDRNDYPLYPLVPGGSRQRELALRTGINLVMYTLTGNYKADQVHVKDLLQRLGH